ncbi:lytic transglycosylase domain-containing protein [Thiorhodovibrio frisius]|uniref:Soluble lytic murein transglycosylase-like protein n=1 Tax=Thiorhodovibrio frisius TaxID=631362 RepID=H8YX19_9GAMM|nr:lytic transglycosylase domain-containing protein [Thiorhodovibrio frisius]EIC22995.1 soluble lytic murein transglycosylase-like protein [Thiorhodovibrio frisius]WPL22737.1 Membrane-bound lytic murein transglycosylase C precursor [Thiorhodovibrio frisius]
MSNRIVQARVGRHVLVAVLVAVGLTEAALADAAATKAPEPTTKSPETKAPETKAPETKAPETKATAEPAALPKPPATPVPSRAELVKLIDSTAAKYGLEPALVHAIVRAESNYNPHAVSRVGAVGLMQVMPKTGADYGVTDAGKLFDPTINAQTGARHLKRLLGKYSIGKAVMAYNAGEGALERSNGYVTYPETQVYTHRVLTTYLRGKGIEPYSPEAQKLTGIRLTPAMARASSSSSSIQAVNRKVSRLRLRLEPTWVTSPLSKHALDPRAHQIGPKSKPMFVLERPTVRQKP